MARIPPEFAGGKNVCAFLDMIARSEGTAGKGDDGYNVVCGGGLFATYKDHPRKSVWLPNLGIYSTAAGRYQLLSKYFDAYKRLLSLKGFDPVSQDMIAIQQIREQKALPAIQAGDFARAVQLCANIWASLPGAGYGQRENKLQQLVTFYKAAGGTISA